MYSQVTFRPLRGRGGVGDPWLFQLFLLRAQKEKLRQKEKA